MPKKDRNEPVLKTCSIDVKVITVNNRQINKSFLKQLFRESLINEETGCLMGTPWGYIKLPIEDCKEEDHLHVIWQKDEQSLKTSCVAYEPPEEKISKIKSVMSNLFTVMFLMDALKEKPEWLDNLNYKEHDYNDGEFVNIDYIDDYSWKILYDDVNHVVDIWYGIESVNIERFALFRRPRFEDEKDFDEKTFLAEMVEESRNNIYYRIKELLRKSGLSEGSAHDEVLREYEKLSYKLDLFKANWKKSVSTILKAGQIFIP